MRANDIRTISLDTYLTLPLDREVLTIDVRETSEWVQGHIPGAIHISLSLLPLVAHERLPNLNKEIILYCRSGARAYLAAEELQKHGYAQVFVLDGGYEQYVQSIDRK